MDLSPHTVTSGYVDSKRWLGSKHGADCMFSITLDLTDAGFAALIEADTTRVGNWGYIPSGVALTELANGLYGVADGVEVADVHLFEAVHIRTGADGSTTAAGSGFWHGVVIQAEVPGTFADANRVPADILYR